MTKAQEAKQEVYSAVSSLLVALIHLEAGGAAEVRLLKAALEVARAKQGIAEVETTEENDDEN